MRRATLLACIVLFMRSHSLRAQIELGEAVHQLAVKIQDSLTEQSKRRVAVFPFKMNGGSPNELCTYLADDLIGNFVQSQKLQIAERGLLKDVMEEIDRGSSGVVDPETARKARIKGADAILTGTITDFSTYVAVNARLIDTETGLVFAAAQVKVLRDEGVLKLLGSTVATQAEHKKQTSEETSSGMIPGLRGEYFNSPPFQGKQLPTFPESAEYIRIDKTINFDWGTGVPAPRVSADYFFVKWQGEIYGAVTGTYRFRLFCNDGCKLYVDDKAVVEDWRMGEHSKNLNWNTTGGSPVAPPADGDIYLKGDLWHKLEVDFAESVEHAVMEVLWRPPGESELQILPTNYLRTKKQ